MNDIANFYPANRPLAQDEDLLQRQKNDLAINIEVTVAFRPFNQRNDMFNRAF